MKTNTPNPTSPAPPEQPGRISWQLLFLAACIGLALIAIALKVIGLF